ncbi:MAG: DUF359 domain-containing protein [Desulfurococcales archaeon]|nr:DUF359 domain-containing protein [Desulfurococcales archaeon]
MKDAKRVYRIPVLLLPKWLRPSLSIPQGTLFIGKNIIKGLKSDIGVGDIVSSTLKTSVKIIDFRTKRHIKDKYTIKDKYCRSFIIMNPPGTISLSSTTLLTQQDMNKNIYIVIGEEDLLVLPLLKNKSWKKLFYGQPPMGVVRVVRTKYSSKRVLEILKTFKPVIYAYTSDAK